nr:leucine-rich repeat domain-containing protein [Clostridia bacterium]
MRGFFKTSFCVLLAFCVSVFAALPAGFAGPGLWASAAEVVDSGTCGDGLMWTLDSDGVLTVTGSGTMDDYLSTYDPEPNMPPWDAYAGDIVEVVVSPGAENIGAYAFSGLENLTSVSIPDSVVSVGSGAFSGCSSLPEAALPDTVTSIGNWAFGDCSALTGFTFPESLTRIGEGAFGACELLTEVTIPDSVEYIGEFAFFDCYALRSATVGSGVTVLSGYAFQNCGLISVTLDRSVRSIGLHAFEGCMSLRYVFFTGSEEEWSSVDVSPTDSGLLPGAVMVFDFD